MAFKQNTAVTGFAFLLLDNTGAPVTSGTTNGFFTGDNGTQTALTNTPVHKGNGQWSVNLTAAELNFETVGFLFTNASAVSVHFIVKTVTKLVSDLQDITQTDIVSAGPITTSAGAVSNVTTVQTTLNNTDMRGTDGAAQPTDIVTGGPINTLGGAVSGVTNVVETQTVINTTKANITEALGTPLSEPGLGIFAGNLSTFYGNSGNTTTKIVDNVGGASASDVWSFATRELTSGNNIVLTKGVGLLGLNDLSFNDMWVNNTLPESYAANAAEGTPAEMFYMLWSDLRSPERVATTWNDYRLDNSTVAMQFSLDDADKPTRKIRTG